VKPLATAPEKFAPVTMAFEKFALAEELLKLAPVKFALRRLAFARLPSRP